MLLSGPMLTAALYAVKVANRASVRDGLPPSHQLVQLRAVLMSALGQSDIEPDADVHDAGELTITAREAAAMLNRSERTVRRMAEQLDGRLVGGQWRFDAATIREHLEGAGQ